jgi:hypothetical protein
MIISQDMEEVKQQMQKLKKENQRIEKELRGTIFQFPYICAIHFVLFPQRTQMLTKRLAFWRHASLRMLTPSSS